MVQGHADVVGAVRVSQFGLIWPDERKSTLIAFFPMMEDRWLQAVASNWVDDVVHGLASNPGWASKANKKTGHTPLHSAAENGNIEVVRLLLRAQRGAEPSARTSTSNLTSATAHMNGIEWVAIKGWYVPILKRQRDCRWDGWRCKGWWLPRMQSDGPPWI